MSNTKRDTPQVLTRGVGSKPQGLRRVEKALQSSVDWFTATTLDDKLGLLWLESFHHYCKFTWEGQRNEKAPFNKWGYVGEICGGQIWAAHPEYGYLFTCSSDTAQHYWQKALDGECNVTRLDLAVTVEFTRPLKNLAAKHYNMLVKNKLLTPEKRIMTSGDGGQTLYVGSVRSEQMGRLYDKGIQSGKMQPGYCWRYEVTFRKPRASIYASALMDLVRKNVLPETSITNTVFDWFLNRSVRPMFDPDGEGIIAEVHYQETSVDRKLKWLRNQVRPSVQWLIDNNFGEEARAALGIDDW